MSLGGLVLTGGKSRRMGADKALLDWHGAPAVARACALARAAGADPVLTVGRTAYGLPAAMGEAPDGGPAAGVVEGARALAAAGCRRALVLAVDAPTIEAADLAPLIAAPGSAAYAGLHLPAVIEIADLPPSQAFGWPMGRLLEVLKAARPPAPREALVRLRGANTPGERERLLAAASPEEA